MKIINKKMFQVAFSELRRKYNINPKKISIILYL